MTTMGLTMTIHGPASLAAVMAAVRSTCSTTTQATPMQLVFGCDAIINTKFIADWEYIRQRKQNIVHSNNERENAKRIPHTYQIGAKKMQPAQVWRS